MGKETHENRWKRIYSLHYAIPGIDSCMMAQVQEFLNKYGSEVRKNKEDVKIWCSSEDVHGPPICVDRCQVGGFANVTNIPQLDYSSCIYCDVEPEAFWKFLYSDEWNDSVILRVFYGELYLDLDMKLTEMLKDETLSKHITCTYLQVKNNKDEIKFDLVPETVRIELTYYGKNLEKQPCQKAETFLPSDFPENTYLGLSSDYIPETGKKVTRRKSQKAIELSKHASKEIETISPNERFLNLNLAHYYCLNSLEIKEKIESDCDFLEIKLRGKLGLSKETFGISQTSFNEAWQLGEGREPGQPRQFKKKIRPVRQRQTIERKRKRPVKGKDGKWKIVEDDPSNLDDEIFMETIRKEIGERLKKEMRKKGATGELFSGEDGDGNDPLAPKQFSLDSLGLMLKGEKFSKFSKMKKAKPVFNCAEGFEDGAKPPTKNKSERTINAMKLHKRRAMFKRVSSLSKNLHEFALLVLGITDSVELYRTLLWMGNDKQYNQGKWRKWFESKFQKNIFPAPKQLKVMKPEDLEECSEEDESDVGGEGDAVTARDKTDGKGKGKVGKGKIDKGKVGKEKTAKSRGNKQKQKNTAVVSTKAEKKQRSLDAASGDKVKQPGGPQKKKKEKKKEDGEGGKEEKEEEEEGEETDEEDEEQSGTVIEETTPPPVKYDWEISGEDNLVRSKTEIIIPDFKLDEYEIQTEMILKAMDHFIIRKERVTSSKDLTFTSLAFIRPSYAKKLFQVQ